MTLARPSENQKAQYRGATTACPSFYISDLSQLDIAGLRKKQRLHRTVDDDLLPALSIYPIVAILLPQPIRKNIGVIELRLDDLIARLVDISLCRLFLPAQDFGKIIGKNRNCSWMTAACRVDISVFAAYLYRRKTFGENATYQTVGDDHLARLVDISQLPPSRPLQDLRKKT